MQHTKKGEVGAIQDIILIRLVFSSHFQHIRGVRVMVFNATFKNISVISWRSVLLEEIGIHGENHRPVTSYWQTLSHNVVSRCTPHSNSQLWIVVISTDCICRTHQSNYHTITTAPFIDWILYTIFELVLRAPLYNTSEDSLILVHIILTCI